MPVCIVAELSANHNQDLSIAKESIKAAQEAGADAVKLQTYTADTLTIQSDEPAFRLSQGTLWDGLTLYELYQQAYTPWEWHEELFRYAGALGISLFSTPFDATAVDFLERLQNPIYKIASFELPDIPLIEYAAAKGKPMVLSTGIATLEEIEEAVMACRRVGNDDLTLLQCTSEYPARVEEARLANMMALRQFGVKVGLSDHSMGHEAACLATAMGATMIEKHFILDRSIGGPDAAFSMDREEFAAMVQAVRRTERIVGQEDFSISESKARSRVFARSLFVVEDVRAGELLTEQSVRSIRPGYGLAPKHLGAVLGQRAARDLRRGTALSWEDVEID